MVPAGPDLVKAAATVYTTGQPHSRRNVMALKPIAYVQASWHTDITDHCRRAFMAELAKRGYAVSDVELFAVPGSLEIPLMARRLARTGRYAAVCASGLVVDGGIYRHDFVAQAVEKFFRQHMATKGRELAEACVAIIGQLAAVA
jgi:6,7-dimethyl-8-ribityllumazine synthase